MSAFIVGVAVRHKGVGLVICLPAPSRHSNIMHSLTMMGISVERHGEFKQGFVDSEAKFLDRHEALERVMQNGQPLLSIQQSETLGLFSEDLW